MCIENQLLPTEKKNLEEMSYLFKFEFLQV